MSEQHDYDQLMNLMSGMEIIDTHEHLPSEAERIGQPRAAGVDRPGAHAYNLRFRRRLLRGRATDRRVRALYRGLHRSAIRIDRTCSFCYHCDDQMLPALHRRGYFYGVRL